MEHIKCPECGEIVDKNMDNCPKCGFPFSENEEIIDVKICPECKKVVEGTLSSCSNCGYPFDEIGDFEKLLHETEQKAHEQELRALEAERKLKELQEEKERRRLEEEKRREQEEKKRCEEEKRKEREERKRKLAESKKKMEEAKKRAIEAERKLAELAEEENKKIKNEVDSSQLTKEETNLKEEEEKKVEQKSKDNGVEEIVEKEETIELDASGHDAKCNAILEELKEDTLDENEKESIDNENTNIPIVVDVIQGTSENNNNVKMNFWKNKQNIFVLGGTLVLILIGVIYFTFRGTPVESVKLEHENASLELGSLGKIEYTITPSDATNKEVTWETSDDSIVSVDEKGLLVGKKEGTCEITVKTKNGKTAVCKITVEPSGPDLQAIYLQYCDPSYASVAADGSYLSIDTDPDSAYLDYEEEALLAIFAVNEELGIPDSVIEKMGSTRALDGVQTQICGDIEVRWSYHPDNGLEVIYSLVE